MQNSILLSTAYLPNIQYLKHVLQAQTIVLEKHEHFVKQTYRSRCNLVNANGLISLSIPLLKQSDKELICEKKISYAENWQQQHWRTIVSAYKNSPYFEFFEHEFKPFYETKHEFLFDFNLALLNTILNLLRVKKNIEFTNQYQIEVLNNTDLRHLVNLNSNHNYTETPYKQVFYTKQQFTNNLSCLDAIFNIGLDTLTL
jgi:hypothetical protein